MKTDIHRYNYGARPRSIRGLRRIAEQRGLTSAEQAQFDELCRMRDTLMAAFSMVPPADQRRLLEKARAAAEEIENHKEATR